MRFVPHQLMLWLTILLIVPAMTLAFYDQGLLQLAGLLVIAFFVVTALVDLQISRHLLTSIEVKTPELVRGTKQKEFDLPIEFKNTGPKLTWDPLRHLHHAGLPDRR